MDATDDNADYWSRRSVERIEEIRYDSPWLQTDSSTTIQTSKGEVEWWTFGGNRAHATLSRELSRQIHNEVTHDSFSLTFPAALKLQDVEAAIGSLGQQEVATLFPAGC